MFGPPYIFNKALQFYIVTIFWGNNEILSKIEISIGFEWIFLFLITAVI